MVVFLQDLLGESAVAMRQTAVDDATCSGGEVFAFHALAVLVAELAGPAGGGSVAMFGGLGVVALNAHRSGGVLDLLDALGRATIKRSVFVLVEVVIDLLVSLMSALLGQLHRALGV